MAEKRQGQKVTLFGKYGEPIGHSQRVELNKRLREEQRPKTGTEQAKAFIGGFVRKGLENFHENATRPIVGEPQRRPSKSQSRKQPREMSFPGSGTPFNFDLPRGGGLDIDLSLHPDPMYQGMGRRKGESHRGRRKVVRTTTTYED